MRGRARAFGRPGFCAVEESSCGECAENLGTLDGIHEPLNEEWYVNGHARGGKRRSHTPAPARRRRVENIFGQVLGALGRANMRVGVVRQPALCEARGLDVAETMRAKCLRAQDSRAARGWACGASYAQTRGAFVWSFLSRRSVSRRAVSRRLVSRRSVSRARWVGVHGAVGARRVGFQ